jgi:hypothetical protein
MTATQYLGSFFAYDSSVVVAYCFEDKRAWEFRYKIQHEEPRGKWYSKIIDSLFDRSKRKEWIGDLKII